jgi:hypothetical protein
MPLELPPDLEARLRVAAEARGEEYNRFAVSFLAEALARDAGAAEAWERARAEAQAILNGPFRPFGESTAALRDKYGLPDLSHLSREELAALTDETIAQIDPAMRAEMEPEELL